MKKEIKVGLFFIVAYALSQLMVYLFSRENFFTSPMYILIPIVGFFAFYFLTPVVEKYTKGNFYALLLSFIVICLIVQYVVVYIYAYQIYVVLNEMAIPKNIGVLKQFIESAFFPFVVSAVVGMFASKKKIL